MTRWVMVRWLGALCSSAVALAQAAPAAAQNEGWGSDDAASEDDEKKSGAPPGEAPAPSDSEEPAADAELSAPPAEAAVDEAPEPESPETTASSGYLVGLRYRGIYIPQTVLNWFMDGGESVYVNGFGPEFSIRDGKKEYILSAWVALYDMDPVPIKGSSDDELAWEIVASDMTAVYLSADYLWHTRLARSLELSYGGGAGLGFLFGDLYRTQATLLPGGTEGDPDDYIPCPAEGFGNYCDDINDHYPGYTEPSWFNGGSKPNLFPWLAAQVGLRYQPHEKIVTRLDIGIGTSGVFFGVGVDYSL